MKEKSVAQISDTIRQQVICAHIQGGYTVAILTTKFGIPRGTVVLE